VCVVALTLGALPAAAGLPVQPDPVVEAQIDSLMRAAVDHAFDGRLDLGLETVDYAQTIAPRDPRIGLTRFRLLRENYPVSIFQEELARKQEPALMRELEDTIALCDSMLELDETDAAAYLYRGWAYMNKAQTQLIAGHMRAAAGSSRHGKGDFDKFYEYHPQGDPDAATVLGAFLFYADTLPGFFKFIRWLVRVPGGDRDRGIALLKEGAEGRGYTYPDALLLLGVTYYLFDGNLEDSSRILREAVERYPNHPWVVEYTASMSYVFPEFTGQAIAYQSAILEGWGETTIGWYDPVRYRLLWSLGREYLWLGEYQSALKRMGEIVVDAPPEPARIAPSTHLSAIRLAGRLGRELDVKWLCENIPDEKRYRQLKHSFESACEHVAGEEQARAFSACGDVRQALYAGRTQEAARLLEETIAAYGQDAETRFLQAEIAARGGDVDVAVGLYAEAIEMAEASGQSALKVKSLIRRGELYISLGEYGTAKKSFEEAKDTEPGESMLANFIRGRIRYLERQED
jgi:tetratricopeptide (TPR) repeat protein